MNSSEIKMYLICYLSACLVLSINSHIVHPKGNFDVVSKELISFRAFLCDIKFLKYFVNKIMLR